MSNSYSWDICVDQIYWIQFTFSRYTLLYLCLTNFWWTYINPYSVSKHHALCGQHELLHHWGADLWTLWKMRGGEEGGDGLGQVQEDPLWILLHRVRSHKYESWSHLHQLHGFKPFRFYLREDAEHAVRFINGTRLDDRIIRCVVCLIEIIPFSLAGTLQIAIL